MGRGGGLPPSPLGESKSRVQFFGACGGLNTRPKSKNSTDLHVSELGDSGIIFLKFFLRYPKADFPCFPHMWVAQNMTKLDSSADFFVLELGESIGKKNI